MKICLDTNAYSAFKRNSLKVISLIEKAEEIIIPCIVLGELYFGFYKGSKTEKNISELEIFLELPGVIEYKIDKIVAEKYSRLVKSLYEKGKPIPTNDIWIAAVSMVSLSNLITADKHYENVPTLAFQSF
jgi:tRNA(fMet)-specific endonuclease VapC